MDMILMTKAGYDKLRAEVEHLDNVEMPRRPHVTART